MEKILFHVAIDDSLCFLVCHKPCCPNSSRQQMWNVTALQPRFSVSQLNPDTVKPSHGIHSHVLCDKMTGTSQPGHTLCSQQGSPNTGFNPSPIDISWIFLLHQWNAFTFKFSGKSRVLPPVFWSKQCMEQALDSH